MSPLSQIIEAGGGPRIQRLTLAMQSRVISSDASKMAPGDEVTVLIPIWDGPPGESDTALNDFVMPLVSLKPDAAELLVAVASTSSDGKVVEPAGPAGAILGAADGSLVVVLSAPDASGRAWGMTDLDAIEATAKA